VPDRPQVLVVKTGTCDPVVVTEHGDYDVWFRTSLEDCGCEVTVAPVYEGTAMPSFEGFDGVLITGSKLNVRQEEPWMAEVGRWSLDVATAGTPVLSVCFGHQLVGEALGGWVDTHPGGPEVGRIDVSLTREGRADPLFAGLAEPIVFHASHWCALVSPPTDPRVVLLAENAHTTWQAFSVGPNFRAVQFHPELTANIMRAVLASRKLDAEADDDDQGRVVMRNWVEGWLR
jgi:GMP synthase (glutamine-hydrolysing)